MTGPCLFSRQGPGRLCPAAVDGRGETVHGVLDVVRVGRGAVLDEREHLPLAVLALRQTAQGDGAGEGAGLRVHLADGALGVHVVEAAPLRAEGAAGLTGDGQAVEDGPEGV